MQHTKNDLEKFISESKGQKVLGLIEQTNKGLTVFATYSKSGNLQKTAMSWGITSLDVATDIKNWIDGGFKYEGRVVRYDEYKALNQAKHDGLEDVFEEGEFGAVVVEKNIGDQVDLDKLSDFDREILSELGIEEKEETTSFGSFNGEEKFDKKTLSDSTLFGNNFSDTINSVSIYGDGTVSLMSSKGNKTIKGDINTAIEITFAYIEKLANDFKSGKDINEMMILFSSSMIKQVYLMGKHGKKDTSKAKIEGLDFFVILDLDKGFDELGLRGWLSTHFGSEIQKVTFRN